MPPYFSQPRRLDKPMDRGEIWIRIIGLIPLLFITYQVVRLRLILVSRAWTLLASGYVLFTVLRIVPFFVRPRPVISLAVALAGWIIVGWGFWLLRLDLHGVLKRPLMTDKDSPV